MKLSRIFMPSVSIYDTAGPGSFGRFGGLPTACAGAESSALSSIIFKYFRENCQNDDAQITDSLVSGMELKLLSRRPRLTLTSPPKLSPRNHFSQPTSPFAQFLRCFPASLAVIPDQLLPTFSLCAQIIFAQLSSFE